MRCKRILPDIKNLTRHKKYKTEEVSISMRTGYDIETFDNSLFMNVNLQLNSNY